MKMNYTTPEVKLVCFEAIERLASSGIEIDFDHLLNVGSNSEPGIPVTPSDGDINIGV